MDAVAAALHGRAGAAREVGLDLSPTSPATSPRRSPWRSCTATSVAAAVLVPDVVLAGAAERRALRCAAAPAPAIDAALRARPGTAAPGAGAASSSLDSHRHGIELLHGVDMEVTVEIGRTRMTVRDLLELTPGAVLELDRAAGSPADLLVNGRLIARGEVVVIDEDFGLRITEIAVDAAAG